MTAIDVDAPVVTLINVFTVEPENQDRLVRELDRATVEVMRGQEGFVSANIHRGLDGRSVANYAQWRTKEHFEKMLARPEVAEHIERIRGIIVGFEPRLYEVASVHKG